MSGQRQKAREELVNQRGGRDRVVQRDPDQEPLDFPLSQSLLPETRAYVRECRTEMAGYWRPTDRPVIERYIANLDSWARQRKMLEEEGALVAGKHGPRINPRLRVIEFYEKRLDRDEGKLGLDPQARLRLGIKQLTGMTAIQRLRQGGERKPPARMPAVPELVKA